MYRFSLLFIVFLTVKPCYSVGLPQFEDPSYLDVVTELPSSFIKSFEGAFAEETVIPWLTIIASTAITYQYDEKMVLDVQQWGRDSGISNKDRTETFLEIGGLPIFRGPTDTGSALYYLGDGWTHFIIAGSFILGGEVSSSSRALATGLQMIHGMTVSTFFSQFLKRATGRETPNTRTEKRGRWRPFPSIETYGSETAFYDAFPSGHVMTATHTFTILYENYPEYRSWIVPIGATWVSLLGLQMMNNGVHWASDYPLGIAMGVFFGRLSARLWRKPQVNGEANLGKHDFLPYTYNDTPGLKWVYAF